MTALIAAAAPCGPLAQSALADDITFVSPSRQLVMTGTVAGSQVTVGPGTQTDMEYRFESTASITVAASADAFCGPSALVVECDDDPTPPPGPADDITSIRVDGAAGVDTISASGALPSAGIVLLDGGADNDVLTGGVRPETLRGGPDNDAINGGPGADDINGEPTRSRRVTAKSTPSAVA